MWFVSTLLITLCFGVFPPWLAMIVTGLSLLAYHYHYEPDQSLTSLIMLYLELKKRQPAKYELVEKEIDRLFAESCQRLKITERERLAHVQKAQTELERRLNAIKSVETLPTPELLTPTEKPATPIPETVKPPPIPPIPVQPPIPIQEPIQSVEKPEPIQKIEVIKVEPIIEEPKPVKKTRFARLFSREFMTQILFPFLWQNIGWFIGGFCFVSGSIFFVAYTEGFTKSLVVFVVLCLYIFIFLWGGYQIRKRRSDLVITSNILLTLGILLIPLTFAVNVRLIENALLDPFLMGFAISLSLVMSYVFLKATTLASGLIARGLQAEHPHLFIGLSALQFTIPLLQFFPYWWSLAALHLSLLGILSYALRRFTQHWLHTIFIDQDKTAYYTAGTLAYTAIVSFVHTTWQTAIVLPEGYTGPFLMTFCLLLFYVDVQFKQFVNRFAVLSRFSFVIYGLSVVALLIPFLKQAVLALEITLILGISLYGGMLWAYLTLPPLYLFLAGSAGLYGLLILRHFPDHWYFLLSLPGLAAIMSLQRLAQRREAVALMLVICRTLFVMGLSLLGWSLFHAPLGEIAFLTALTVTFIAVRALFVEPCPVTRQPVAPTQRCYSVVAATTLTMAYVPLYFGINWLYQFSLLLFGLAVLWTGWGLRHLSVSKTRCSSTVLINGALLSLIASLILVATVELASTPLISLHWLFLFGGGIFLWLSLRLRIRSLFYCALILLGLAGFLLKHHYFPHSSGRGFILLALVIWLLLWRLERYAKILRPHSDEIKTFQILGISVPQKTDVVSTVYRPLSHAFIALWVLSLWRVGAELFTSNFTVDTTWAELAGWSALVTILVSGHTRQLRLLPISVVLILSVLWTVSSVNLEWSPFLNVSYALLLVLITRKLLKHTEIWVKWLGWQRGYGVQGGRVQTDYFIHQTTFAINLLSVCFIGVAYLQQQANTLAVMATLSVFVPFLWQAGQHYRQSIYSYLVLITIAILEFILYKISLWILNPTAVAFFFILLALGFAVVAQFLLKKSQVDEKITTIHTLYTQPLYHSAYFSFGLALLLSFVALLSDEAHGLLSILFIILAIIQLPLLRALPNAALIRGVSIPALLTIALVNFYSSAQLETLFYPVLCWSFLLWGISAYLLPYVNARWTQWAIDTTFGYTLGFLLIIGIFFHELSTHGFNPITLAIVTLYCFLLFRCVDWVWLPWLTGVGTVAGGISVGYNVAIDAQSSLLFFMIIVLWMNGLLQISVLCARSYTKILPIWRIERLAQPLFVLPTFFLSTLLVLVSKETMTLANHLVFPSRWLEIVALSILVNFSFLHSLTIRFYAFFAHFFLFSLLNTSLLFLLSYFTVSLSLSIWTLSLVILHILFKRFSAERFQAFTVIIRHWLFPSFSIALFLLLIEELDASYDIESLFTLALLIGLSFTFGVIYDTTTKFVTLGNILVIIFLHVHWFVWLPDIQIVTLLPYYALQDVLLAGGIYWLRHLSVTKLSVFLQAGIASIWVSLASVAWLGHGLYFLTVLQAGGHTLGVFNHGIAILAGLLLIGAWWHSLDQQTDDSTRIYLATFLVGLYGFYIRLVWVGFIPPMIWDTAALIGLSFGLLIFHQYRPFISLQRLTLWIPLIALLTVPLQLKSWHTSSTLLAIATLYLVLQRQIRETVPFYFGLLALNVSIYLWIPGLAQDYQLLQIYTVPAALTVLLMLQLHLLELKQSIMNTVRLSALSTLYASATLDVFLRESSTIFILAIVLSLGGILLGIALRVRAFLYTGTIFLILNVLGQLISLYPQERLSRAIVLMSVGGIIIVAMIGFSLQREVLLQRMRLIHADLARWE